MCSDTPDAAVVNIAHVIGAQWEKNFGTASGLENAPVPARQTDCFGRVYDTGGVQKFLFESPCRPGNADEPSLLR